ncbi:MAG: TraR/DksA family transcriptional regulator [Anaerolineales bacterium]|jgi:RNA polymerase-binding protein DksA
MDGVRNNKFSEQDIKMVKGKLAEQREELLNTIESHKLDLLQMDLSNPDRTTLAKAFTQRERKEAIIADAEQQWEKIENAFDRLSRGMYGRCSQCGGDINLDRLKVIPAAEYCIECQGNLEKKDS